MNTAKTACTIHVTGHVQGVGFRAWAASQARLLGLTGAVRNTADGSVLIHAEGDKASLQAFAVILKQGSPASTVDKMYISPAAPRGCSRFLIES